MKKFYIEVGGFVSVWRHRCFEIHAENKEEAERKAVEKFIKVQSKNGDCDDAEILGSC